MTHPVSPRLRHAALALVVMLISTPVFAQVDLTGVWRNLNQQDWMERGGGSDPVDYLGIPLNDDGRARALSYNYSLLAQPEHQCGLNTPFYGFLDPFGNNIWTEYDQVTGKIVAYKIGAWLDKDIVTIWMDGRPHPSKNAFHPYSGFTTGEWQGDTLTTYTTHMKDGFLRRNAVSSSDQATMTMHITRHGELLTMTALVVDPVYLTEPYVLSHSWRLDPTLNMPAVPTPCEPIAELPRMDQPGVVPHYLPGKNPFVNELTEMYHLPLIAVLGGAETLYPEFRQKLKDYVPPAICVRYCCGPGTNGLHCITDGSGKPQ
jgi:hypothetical protein